MPHVCPSSAKREEHKNATIPSVMPKISGPILLRSDYCSPQDFCIQMFVIYVGSMFLARTSAVGKSTDLRVIMLPFCLFRLYCVGWIYLAQDTNKWRSLVHAVIHCWVPEFLDKVENC
jgi:hypothetical protein